MWKKIALAVLAAILSGQAVAYYLWNKPHEDISAAKPALSISASELFAAFETDEAAANAQYLDKVVEVLGTVAESGTNEDGSARVVLESGGMFGVACSLDPLAKHPRTAFPVGEQIRLKGKCSGYNLDVQLDRCVEMR
ncbi:MAG: OB-fold protein [Saprospiraceae bacterium]